MSRIIRKATGLPASDGAGVKLTRIIGQPNLKHLDPFLMLDEFGSSDAVDYIAGFPEHPHRGFQTVTYMLNGKMGHKDSVGNQGIIEDGGLQWMNAGKGIVHEEMPQQSNGLMRGFQLWVNLPAKDKMSSPGYEDIPSTQIPEVDLYATSNPFIDETLERDSFQSTGSQSQAPQGKVRVLAGNFQGIQGAVKTHAVDPQFYDFHADETLDIAFNVSSEYQGFIYVYEKSVSVGNTLVEKGQIGIIEFSNHMVVEMQAGSRAIFVAGTPIKEPIVQYGPFVMNTEQEIHQAIQDYQSNRFV